MGRCSIQIVMGPAGSGKSTYCRAMQDHAETKRRRLLVANMDPAAEYFSYEPVFDIRDCISVTEVMRELGLGPNGALVYAMEYVVSHLDWLQECLDDLDDEDYLLLDCPGQMELYTHVPVMKTILDSLRLWGYEGRMVSIFCVDAAFLVDLPKFLSGSLLALSAMVALELPHINVLTKADLMAAAEIENILSQSASQLWYKERDARYGNWDNAFQEQQQQQQRPTMAPPRTAPQRRDALTDALCQLLEDFSMVSFIPLNIRDEDSMDHVLATADHAIQYGEDLEVQTADNDEEYDGYTGEDE